MNAHVKAICLADGDNVANVLEAVERGQSVYIDDTGMTKSLVAGQMIRQFHKIALQDLPEGTSIRRDGYVIGVAVVDISVGDWVHIHNIASLRAVNPNLESN